MPVTTMQIMEQRGDMYIAFGVMHDKSSIVSWVERLKALRYQ